MLTLLNPYLLVFAKVCMFVPIATLLITTLLIILIRFEDKPEGNSYTTYEL